MIRVREGKSKNAKRNVNLLPRVREMLIARMDQPSKDPLSVFGCTTGRVQHQHAKLRADLKLDPEFVIHSLRHTCLTRLGMAGVDPFRIKKIAGHCSITVSEKYVHPSPESQERAFELLDALNAKMLNEATKGVTENVQKVTLQLVPTAKRVSQT
jgi:integrase